MTTDNIIDLLIIACGGPVSMVNISDAHAVGRTQGARAKGNHRTQLHQLRKEQQKQDN